MSKAFPDTFYHSLSQTRLKGAIHEDALPGLSRFHLDPEGKNLGVWLTDKLDFVLKNGYGGEESDEVMDTWDAAFMAKITGRADAEPLVIKKGIPGIILELKDLEEERLLQHPLFPEQFFYIGNIDWRKVKSFLVREHYTETEVTARSLAETLQQERSIAIGVRTFQPLDYLREDTIIKQELKNKIKEEPRIEKENNFKL